MKTESGQSDTREQGFVSSEGRSSVSASQAEASELAASNAALDSDDKRAIDQADASQSAISDNQSASFPSASFPSASFPSQSVSRDQSTGSKIPYWLIGTLLTATAIAKLWMLLTDPFADVRVSLPKEILWLSVAFELWLALENFRLRDHRIMAFVNTVVFASFAIFASVRLAMGYGSCGCSGSLELPAWLFILIDVVIVAWFTCTAARRFQVVNGLGQLVQSWMYWSPESRGRLVGLGVFAALIVNFQFPVVAPLRAMMLGEQPIQAVVRIDGDFKLDRELTGRVEIQNLSAQSAKIVGISSSCRCIDFAEDPVSKSISANKTASLQLIIKPNKLGPLHHRVVMFLDHPKQFRLNVNVFGTVKGVDR